MGIPNTIAVRFNGTILGGSSAYQLLSPYILDKSYSEFRLVADVLVTAEDQGTLQELSATLEDAFRARLRDGNEIVIEVGPNAWTYTVGTDILSVESAITKSGNPETDYGCARAYTVTVNAQLPADGGTDAGLRDVEVAVEKTPSRQTVVTFRGAYTATDAGSALERYRAAFDLVAENYLALVKIGVTWELRSEDYTLDRQGATDPVPAPHSCRFFRQYVELLADQSSGLLNDPDIRDHRLTFTDRSQFPGDSDSRATRLRRVTGAFDCAVDIDETRDVQSVYAEKVRPFLIEQFEAEFEPTIFGIEEAAVSYDRTASRMAVSFQFVYRSALDSSIVESSTSVTYREARTIDYTPTHDTEELSMEADVGWSTLERIWTRTVVCIGTGGPIRRITKAPEGGGAAGTFTRPVAGLESPDNRNGRRVNRDGWNIIASNSNASPRWLGDPAGNRVQMTVISETVVERFHRAPRPGGGATNNPIP